MKDMEKTYFLGTPREMRSDKKTTHGFLEVMKESAIDGYQEIFFMPLYVPILTGWRKVAVCASFRQPPQSRVLIDG